MEIARDVYLELPPDAQKDASWSIGYKLAQQSPDDAIAWARENASGPARENVVTALVSALARNSSENLDTVLNQFPTGADRDAALRGAAQSKWSNPEEAMPYAERITDPVLREKTFRSIAGNWFYRDGPAARSWLAGTQELSPEVKAMLLRQSEEN